MKGSRTLFKVEQRNASQSILSGGGVGKGADEFGENSELPQAWIHQCNTTVCIPSQFRAHQPARRYYRPEHSITEAGIRSLLEDYRAKKLTRLQFGQ